MSFVNLTLLYRVNNLSLRSCHVVWHVCVPNPAYTYIHMVCFNGRQGALHGLGLEREERDFSVYTEAQPSPQLLPSAACPKNEPTIGTLNS